MIVKLVKLGQTQGENMEENIGQVEQRNAQEKHKKFGISGSTLKMIAIISMLIDHIGAAVLWRYLILLNQGITPDIGHYIGIGIDYTDLYVIYRIMRYIGRLGFPLFCFLLIQGFEHTRNRKKYAMRLGLFAFISEIPFDLAFHGKILEFSYQNVFFTLFIGLITIWIFHFIEERKIAPLLRVLANLVALLSGMGIATLLRSDYSYIGVASIVVLYLLRRNKFYQAIGGAFLFSWEITAPIAFLPVFFYNGKRGWNIKYFFYIFYPAHLLLLYIICWFLKIGPVSVM